jgi:hypothetical protein
MVSGSPRAFPRGYRTGTPARFQDEQALMKYEPKLVLCRCGRRRIGRWKKMCSDCWKEEERARKVALMVEQGSKTRETRLCARIAELSLDIWSPDPIKKLAAVRKLMGACRVLEAHIMNPDNPALKKISRPKVELAQFRVLRIDARKFERMWAALIFSGFDRRAPDHRTVQS